MNFLENINKQIEGLNKQLEYLNKVKTLADIFPDICERQDRWGKKYYTSSKANEIATNVDIFHSCGCCSDAALIACFYVKVDDIKVCAEPYDICIGEKNVWGSGDVPGYNWEETLSKNNINPELFVQIEKYFEENPPQRDEEDDW